MFIYCVGNIIWMQSKITELNPLNLILLFGIQCDDSDQPKYSIITTQLKEAPFGIRKGICVKHSTIETHPFLA